MCIYTALYTKSSQNWCIAFLRSAAHSAWQPASGRTRLKEWRMLARHGGKIKIDHRTDTTGYFFRQQGVPSRARYQRVQWRPGSTEWTNISSKISILGLCLSRGSRGLENPVRQSSWASTGQNWLGTTYFTMN